MPLSPGLKPPLAGWRYVATTLSPVVVPYRFAVPTASCSTLAVTFAVVTPFGDAPFALHPASTSMSVTTRGFFIWCILIIILTLELVLVVDLDHASAATEQ